MKSINIFQTYKEFDDKRRFLPTISLNYIEDRNVCVSAKTPKYFYIESKADNNDITFGADTWFGENSSKISYSHDMAEWHPLSSVSKLSLNNGQVVYLKGNGENFQKNSSNYNSTPFFAASNLINVGGSLKELMHPKDELQAYAYGYGFSEVPIFSASLLDLSSTQLAEWCYFGLFNNCEHLLYAPNLPSREMEANCYRAMFSGCSNIVTAPELPADVLAEECYAYMFDECVSLTNAPNLEAETLAVGCYYGMFYGCESLENAPSLPATTLADNCYFYMFKDCTNLINAPELRAETLVRGCYYAMFVRCENLSYILCTATDIEAENCTTNWMEDVSSMGTFVKSPSMELWETGENGIPLGWSVESEVVVDDENVSFEIVNPTENTSTQNGIQVKSSNNIQTNKTFDNKTDVSIYKIDSNPLYITSDKKNISKLIFAACFNSTSNESVTKSCAVSVSEDGKTYSYLTDVHVVADGTITGVQGTRIEQTNTNGIGIEGYDGFTQVTIEFNDLYKYVRIEKDGKETWVNSLKVYTKG